MTLALILAALAFRALTAVGAAIDDMHRAGMG
jgi:hypothetical protein